MTLIVLGATLFSFAPYILQALFLKYKYSLAELPTEETTYILWQVLGFYDRFPYFIVGTSIVLILYNIARGIITYKVSKLREQELELMVTPAKSDYGFYYTAHKKLFWIYVASIALIIFKIGKLLFTSIPLPL